MRLNPLRYPVLIAGVVLITAHGALFAVHKRVVAVGHYQRNHLIFDGKRTDNRPDYGADFQADVNAVCGPQSTTAEAMPATDKPIVFDYYSAASEVTNDGHTLHVAMDDGSTLKVDNITYELKEITFHRVHNSHHPDDLVAHLIHRSGKGHTLVLAVLLREGQANKALKHLWHYLPGKAGERNSLWDVRVDPNELLPADHTYYRYGDDSPNVPCGGPVQWFALTTPAQLSAQQLAAYNHVYQSAAKTPAPLAQSHSGADHS